MIGPRLFFHILGLTAVVLHQLLPEGVEGRAVKCGPFETTSVKCDEDVQYGDTFQLDCSGASDEPHPADMLKASADSIKVCSTTELFTAITSTCGSTDQKLLNTAFAGVTVDTSSTSGWTITSKLTGKDVLIQGTCENTASSKSGYFNARLHTSTTSTTANPSAGLGVDVGGASAGLVVASVVALLGFALVVCERV